MNIHPIAPSFQGNIIYRIAKEYPQNVENQYLYNKVSDIIKKQKLPAIISNNHIDIALDAKYQVEAANLFKNTLNEAGIEFKLLV